jgi:hypothetical protein
MGTIFVIEGADPVTNMPVTAAAPARAVVLLFQPLIDMNRFVIEVHLAS